MTVQEFLVQISTIASVEGEQVGQAELKISGDENIELVLDVTYDKESNIVYINTVEDGE
jgi:hypothetical protein